MVYKIQNTPTVYKNARVNMNSYGRNFLFLLLISLTSNNIFATQTQFTVNNIKFVSERDTLSGTILKPNHPAAAIVIVHGSGQEKRMMEFATLLAENDIAVLTYDKRGVGESGGVYAGPEVGTNNMDYANLNLLSLDASAATNALLSCFSNNQVPIGMIGFSQAGWIIPLAAQKNHNVNFIVLFSGPVVTAREQLRFQFYTNGNPNFWDTHTEAEAREHVINDPDKYQFEDTDPRNTLSKLLIPGLWLFGGRDIQVPVILSIENLETLKANKKHYEYMLFPELNHNTAFSDSKAPIKAVVKWIKAIHLSKKK